MTREYGWTAVGVYLALSALDFPFCFLAVRLIGTETIGHYEHIVVGTVKGWLKWPLQGTGMMEMVADEAVEKGAGGKELERVEQEQGNKRILELEEKSGEEESGQVAIYDHGYREAEKANQGEDASMLFLSPVPARGFAFLLPDGQESNKLTWFYCSSLDTTGPRIRRAQIFHLHSDSPHSCCPPYGG